MAKITVKQIEIKNFRSIKSIKINCHENNLILGANNSGKTTIIDALRWFFTKEYKFESERDLPVGKHKLNSSVSVTLSNSKKITLKFEKDKVVYLIDKKDKKYTNLDTVFHDLKINLNVLYIPSVTNVNDYVKLSGQSPLRKILFEIISNDIKKSPDKWSEYISSKNVLLENNNLIKILNDKLTDWSVDLSLSCPEPDVEDIVKNFIKLNIKENGVETCDVNTVGSGLQRQLIFKLLETITEINEGRKSTENSLDLFLYEEPEAFLHFDQQQELARTLKKLSKTKQVFITTHSHGFLSRNIADLRTVIRVYKENGLTNVAAICYPKKIYDKNISDISGSFSEINPDVECYRYFNYLDGIRGAMFFAEKVLLVEGQTEIAFINKLVDDEKIILPRGMYITEVLGKFNMPRFMNLLKAYKIPYAVLHDLDKSEHQDKWNALIEKVGRNHNSKVYKFDNAVDLERFVGVSVPERKDLKPLSILHKYETGEITKVNLDKFISLINEIFQSFEK